MPFLTRSPLYGWVSCYNSGSEDSRAPHSDVLVSDRPCIYDDVGNNCLVTW